MKKKTKCPICYEEHEIDQYGWIQSCIGYFDLGNFIFEVDEYLRKLREKYGKKKGVREYLKDSKTRNCNKKLDEYFFSRVNVPRKVGKRQELSTLISEECLILASWLG